MPGRRSGEGSASVLRYLLEAMKSKPQEAGPAPGIDNRAAPGAD